MSLHVFVFLTMISLLGHKFCSLLETALRSARTMFLTAKAGNGDKKYEEALAITENPEVFLSALRIGGTFFAVSFGAVNGFSLFASFSSPETEISFEKICVSVFILCAVVLVEVFLLGFLSRKITLSTPEKIIIDFSPFIKVVSFLCQPLFSVTACFSFLFKQSFLADENAQKKKGITEAELRIVLREGEKSGAFESRERTMVEGVFYLGDRSVGAFMTYRSEIAWLDADATLERIKETVSEKRTQRYFPVAHNTLDEIIGVASVEDILFAFIADPHFKLKSVTIPPHFIPETMSALKAFEIFQRKETDFLLVMDEYGGFTGILSMNDLIEEIAGQLAAGSQEGNAVTQQNDGSFMADGSANIDEIAESLSMPDLADEHQEYHTLAGFVLNLAGEIPHAGAVFYYKGFEFRVVSMDSNRIDKVQIIKK